MNMKIGVIRGESAESLTVQKCDEIGSRICERI